MSLSPSSEMLDNHHKKCISNLLLCVGGFVNESMQAEGVQLNVLCLVSTSVSVSGIELEGLKHITYHFLCKKKNNSVSRGTTVHVITALYHFLI